MYCELNNEIVWTCVHN